MDERLERHLCNLRNEVFEAAESRINTECSLIICEGVSMQNSLLMKFSCVPSLYVRVYRIRFFVVFCRTGSLIICEGVSSKFAWNPFIFSFPHYMWGYIPDNSSRCLTFVVPSLYVRVYRSDLLRLWFQNRSLIICEGISSSQIARRVWGGFPHYMWGYICHTSIW